MFIFFSTPTLFFLSVYFYIKYTMTNNLQAVYMKSSYQDYVKSKYDIEENNQILYDDRIMILIYAAEWFKIPKSNILNKISFHPYLTIEDHNKLIEMKKKNYNNVFSSGLFTFSLTYYFQRQKNKSKMNKTVKILKSTIITIPIIFLFYILILKPNFLKKLEISELNKYLKIDLDEKRIIRDIKTFGINI